MRPYKNAFDQIHLSEKTSQRIEDALRNSQSELEAISMQTKKRIRKPILVAAAILAVAVSLSVGAYALTDGQIFNYIHSFLTGGASVVEIENEDGTTTQTVSLDTENMDHPVEVRDGRLYFIGNGEDLDITDEISPETPYIYTYTDDEDWTHYIAVGGTVEDYQYGYAEFLKDADGQWSGGVCIGEYEGVAWLDCAKQELNVPW